MIYLISDTHFGHDKMFLYGPRGFTNIQEHDAQIIKNWNEVVSDCDDVYHLGDVMLGNNEHGLECLKQLNGKIHIICGNHCTDTRRVLYESCDNVVEICYATVIKYGKYRFYLSHYPTLTANKEKHLSECLINLCGHTHTPDKWADWDKGVIYHVECDAHNCTPVLIDDIINDCITEVKKCKEML